MNSSQKNLPEANGAHHRIEPRTANQVRTGVVQSKNGVASPVAKRPIAPPVYRPQSKSSAVQQKTAGLPQPKSHQTAPPAYRPQPVPKVLQAKTAPYQPGAIQPKAEAVRPVAPPVYRPHLMPGVLQAKAALPPLSGTPRKVEAKRPAAPPAYRPQPVQKVLQTKAAVALQSPTAQSPRRPVAPPVYRPEPKRVLQPKMAASQTSRQPVAPPAYRPQPVPKVLQRKIASPDRAASGSARVIQPYREYEDWGGNGHMRVTEDGKFAVKQEGQYGTKKLYAEAGAIPKNRELFPGSNLQLNIDEHGFNDIKGPHPTREATEITLREVDLTDRVNVFEDVQIASDCGKAARFVTGSNQMIASWTNQQNATQQGAYQDPMVAKYEAIARVLYDPTGEAQTTLDTAEALRQQLTLLEKKPSTYQAKLSTANPEDKKAMQELWKQTEPLLLQSIKELKLKVQAANAEEKKYYAFQKAMLMLQGVELRVQHADAMYKKLKLKKEELKAAKKTDEEIKNDSDVKKLVADLTVARKAVLIDEHTIYLYQYNKLKPEDKDKVDKQMGINRFANPGVGDAFTISTGGEPMPNTDSVWNFHWAGVVLTSGADRITLENYASGEAKNTDWHFQVYGVPSNDNERKGQSFHEQHFGVHEQHGTNPTTLKMIKQS